MLEGLTALVTAGPTYEPIDPVRYLGNYSSGKQGIAIAIALRNAGAKVTLVHGPIDNVELEDITSIAVTTADEMLEYCNSLLPVDIAVCTAAVCDWKPQSIANSKLKKQLGQDKLTLELVLNPDILKIIATHPNNRPKYVVGFAAETDDLIPNAQEKLKRKQCDMILANAITQTSTPFGNDMNQVSLVTKDGVIAWPRMSKKEIAEKLVQEISKHLTH